MLPPSEQQLLPPASPVLGRLLEDNSGYATPMSDPDLPPIVPDPDVPERPVPDDPPEPVVPDEPSPLPPDPPDAPVNPQA